MAKNSNTQKLRNQIIEECARQVPTSWLDSLLTGPQRVISDKGVYDGGDIQNICVAIVERIRSLKKNRAVTR